MIGDIDEFLEDLGFERKETHITVQEWGDAFYIHKRTNNPHNSIFS